MSLLRKLPITFQCDLEAVKVINFSVDQEELLPRIPKNIQVMDFDGRAVFSMADLRIKSMRPRHFPKALAFSYRHIALRLMVQSLDSTKSEVPDVFFYRCFADRRWVAQFGNLLTHYRLSPAEINDHKGFQLRQSRTFIWYELTEQSTCDKEPMSSYTKGLHRAYAGGGGQLQTFKISPETWPLRPVHCAGFGTNLFNSARLIGAYEATESIPFLRYPARPLRYQTPNTQGHRP